MNIFLKTTYILSLLVLVWCPAGHSSISEIEEYEVRAYSPVNYGLKDLVFEVRVKDLEELLTEGYNLKNITDVYYRVFWMFPGQFKIEVLGLPDGFVEVENELKQILKEKLEFVIPGKLSTKLRSYQMSYKSKSPAVLQGIDPTQSNIVNRVELAFAKNGKLESLTAFSPHSVVKSMVKSGIKSWSHNKWVVEKYSVESKLPNQVITVDNDIEYDTFSGVGLPTKINVTTKIESLYQEDEEIKKREQSKTSGELEFTKYEVNSGKAKKNIVQ